MAAWMPATSSTEATEALAQAMLRTGYVPTRVKDAFHVRVAADVLIRELASLGYAVLSISKEDDGG